MSSSHTISESELLHLEEVKLESEFGFSNWGYKELVGHFHKGKSFLAFDGEELIGHLLYTQVDFEFELISITVKESHRRKQVGTDLLKSLVSKAKKQQDGVIFLEVAEKNVSAFNLYGKMGFVEISRREKYYKNGDTALVMELKS